MESSQSSVEWQSLEPCVGEHSPSPPLGTPTQVLGLSQLPFLLDRPRGLSVLQSSPAGCAVQRAPPVAASPLRGGWSWAQCFAGKFSVPQICASTSYYFKNTQPEAVLCWVFWLVVEDVQHHPVTQQVVFHSFAAWRTPARKVRDTVCLLQLCCLFNACGNFSVSRQCSCSV